MVLAALKLILRSYRLFSITVIVTTGAWSFLVFRLVTGRLVRRMRRVRIRPKQKGLPDGLQREAVQQHCDEDALWHRRLRARIERGAIVVAKVISIRRLRVAASFIAIVILIGYILSHLGPHSRPVEAQPVNTEISDKSINTGGEEGAYCAAFCPPLRAVLANAYFQGYKCTPSKGTLDNIDRVLRYPTSIGLVRLDVYANQAIKRPEEFKKLTVIRSDIACEGLWMVTKNPELTNYGHIQAFSQRIKFILPERESGWAPTFAFLQENDRDGLGRVPEDNKRYVADAASVLTETASSTSGEVGFFVQFADPENANIKLMVKKGLKVIPVASKKILEMKLSGQSIYQLQTFNLKSGGLFVRPVEATAACTPVAIITGTPELFGNDRDKVDDQRDLIQMIRDIPAEKLLPQENTLVADAIRYAKKLTEQAVEETVALVENTRTFNERLR
jgi:hypothetical protein